MNWIDRIKKLLRAEAAEVSDAVSNLRNDLDADLARKERYLAADPSQRMDMITDDIASSDDNFGALRDKITGIGANADAVAEVADAAEGAAPLETELDGPSTDDQPQG